MSMKSRMSSSTSSSRAKLSSVRNRSNEVDSHHRDVRLCGCDLEPVLRTSSTTNNPGKKFYVCPNSLNTGPKCKYFQWVDEEAEAKKRELKLAEMEVKVSDMDEEFSGCKEIMEFMMLEIQCLQAEVKNLKACLVYFGIFLVVLCVGMKMLG